MLFVLFVCVSCGDCLINAIKANNPENQRFTVVIEKHNTATADAKTILITDKVTNQQYVIVNIDGKAVQLLQIRNN